jgi:hypothetical protein
MASVGGNRLVSELIFKFLCDGLSLPALSIQSNLLSAFNIIIFKHRAAQNILGLSISLEMKPLPASYNMYCSSKWGLDLFL